MPETGRSAMAGIPAKSFSSLPAIAAGAPGQHDHHATVTRCELVFQRGHAALKTLVQRPRTRVTGDISPIRGDIPGLGAQVNTLTRKGPTKKRTL